MSFLDFSSIERMFAHFLPGLPLAAFWLAPVVLLLLGAAAVVDARTGRVPDIFILFGLFLALVVDGLFVDWPFSAKRFIYGLCGGILVAGVNQLWYRIFKRDAIGMGDAKWTALAAMVFPLTPVVMAWILGAWIGILWLGLGAVFRRRSAYVHFAPFLFLGLIAGLISHLCPAWLSILPFRACF
jgi:prepilin signal peptidase PulO-like enzyme (type II secretory pathway)